MAVMDFAVGPDMDVTVKAPFVVGKPWPEKSPNEFQRFSAGEVDYVGSWPALNDRSRGSLQNLNHDRSHYRGHLNVVVHHKTYETRFGALLKPKGMEHGGEGLASVRVRAGLANCRVLAQPKAVNRQESCFEEGQMLQKNGFSQ
ncbi:MAG: hypothetical protein QOJ40_2176 [Verrucomicrobiota bacterium]